MVVRGEVSHLKIKIPKLLGVRLAAAETGGLIAQLHFIGMRQTHIM